eukprot:TRINITY_DN16881_c0_g1_i1.p1 TRINITY_DN16881_c0_g1~~TRINITY_DN16881_c0_g1_i1.p1  ORF type:complete len:673 (-),score=150.35 TRINITY_DN16881_c0_g1_i1:798-2816(-)
MKGTAAARVKAMTSTASTGLSKIGKLVKRGDGTTVNPAYNPSEPSSPNHLHQTAPVNPQLSINDPADSKADFLTTAVSRSSLLQTLRSSVSPAASGAPHHPAEDDLHSFKPLHGDHTDKELWSRSLSSIRTIEGQLKEGRETIQNLSKFFEKYVKIQRQMGQELGRLCKAELSKSSNRDPGDLMASTYYCFMDMLKHISKLADVHQNHAMDIEAFVQEKMDQYEEVYKKKSKDIVTEHKELGNRMGNTKAELAKQKAKCVKALQGVDKKGATEPVAKAYESCLKYEGMITQAVIESQEYSRVHLPAIFSKSQELEESRCLNLRKALDRFVFSCEPFSSTYQEAVDRLRSCFDQVSISDDLKLLVQKSLTTDAPEVFTFEYDLPVTPKELRNQVEPEKRDQFGIGKFSNQTLEQVMELQKVQYPELHLPIIFVCTRAAIRYLNGYDHEGIFRISADQKNLDAFVEQLKENDYSIKFEDPHIPAATMKQWLRELPEPIIPAMFYQDCIAVGDKATPEIVNDVVSRAPPANQAIIHAITSMCREIFSGDHVTLNKMSATNLAIVFAPSMLREPDETKQLSNFLLNYNSEIGFVTAVFNHLVIDPQLIDDDYPDFNNYLCTPVQVSITPPMELAQAASDSSFEHQLPDGWTKETDAEGNIYYFNAASGTSQWEFPQ